MRLALRVLYALRVALGIFARLSWQRLLERSLGRRLPPDDSGADRHHLPAWLKRRRAHVHERCAQALLDGILRLKGCYVKLGQVLSILAGFLPPVYRHKLETLQDAVPPRPFAQMREVFERSLGRAPEACFASIDEQPIAAASLGQVHRARLSDGRAVAVKILYPHIRELIRLDMLVVSFVLRLYQRYLPVGNLEAVHTQLEDLLHRETDYQNEARCMQRLADNFASEPDVRCPEVVEELSSREVLTMSYMEGIKISHLEALRGAGIDPEAVGRRLLEVFFKQLLVDRYFHADPHPGNFLVQAGPAPDRPSLVILDFGAVSEARKGLVEGLIDVLSGFFAKDGKLVLTGFERMGFVAEHGNRALLEQTVLMYFERLLKVRRTPEAYMQASTGKLRQLFDPSMELGKLRELAQSFRYPEGWFYVERSLVMMFGLIGAVAPQLDMLQVGFPYVIPLLMNRPRTVAPPAMPA
jgi:predicted unusual protein kinase regulating ubiquinone biosynthesis (AarF/ABC1/UbiB family)